MENPFVPVSTKRRVVYVEASNCRADERDIGKASLNSFVNHSHLHFTRALHRSAIIATISFRPLCNWVRVTGPVEAVLTERTKGKGENNKRGN